VAGETWLSIGDVSGHGVESGLIMMMTQTSIFTTVNQAVALRPAKVLGVVNRVIRENVSRLGSDRYMTLMVMVLRRDEMIVAGKHQDILVHRKATGATEVVPTTGTWIGVVDDLEHLLEDTTVPLRAGDTVLFFTDGVTEAMNKSGEMFGQERLERALGRYASLAVGEIVKNIICDVQEFMDKQRDDITVVALRRMG
jgi:serine phosphatase RsbU (regulator of sigma subunit)